MKNKILLMITVIMACFLCACGQQTTVNANITENSTEQVTSDESDSGATGQLQPGESSDTELRDILDEININIYPGTTGNGSASVQAASHLLNWGVATGMSTEEIKKETITWLSEKGNSEQVEFSNKLASVYDAYQRLLGPDAEELLEQAGCEDAAYPWSDAPVETIEAIIEVVQLPEDQAADSAASDISSAMEEFKNEDNWPDVAELVNLRGDETTVYLLADGRYMDRINAVYIYDGKGTWTDESGVEWNEAVK